MVLFPLALTHSAMGEQLTTIYSGLGNIKGGDRATHKGWVGWDDSQTGEHRCGIQEGKNKWLALFSLINFSCKLVNCFSSLSSFSFTGGQFPCQCFRGFVVFPKISFWIVVDNCVWIVDLHNNFASDWWFPLWLCLIKNNKRNNL